MVRNEADVEILRHDLNKLFELAQDWQMLFNLEKCVVMHMGGKNLNFTYELGGTILKCTKQERDLGIIIHDS